MNLCGAQWLAYALPCRRFAAALTDVHARLRVDVGRYSFIVSDLHRLLVAGLPAHCETFWTLLYRTVIRTQPMILHARRTIFCKKVLHFTRVQVKFPSERTAIL
jgi:hypothetical protein